MEDPMPVRNFPCNLDYKKKYPKGSRKWILGIHRIDGPEKSHVTDFLSDESGKTYFCMEVVNTECPPKAFCN